ncbi:MAG TPA: hypothetical protein VJL07_00300 [Dehalococcoidia bacterium]|nr:hypothetical protein [Dehalococcoidia bacterium]
MIDDAGPAEFSSPAHEVSKRASAQKMAMDVAIALRLETFRRNVSATFLLRKAWP